SRICWQRAQVCTWASTRSASGPLSRSASSSASCSGAGQSVMTRPPAPPGRSPFVELFAPQRGVPEFHATVHTRRREVLAVRAEGHPEAAARTILEIDPFLSRFGIPDDDLCRAARPPAVPAGRGDALAVGAESRPVGGDRVSLEAMNFLSTRHVPD